MSDTLVFDAIFHFTVLQWTQSKITLMKAIIGNIMILLGETCCQWIVANVNLHTDIALDLLHIIMTFREDHPAVYPLSDIEVHEAIATIMQYTQQLYLSTIMQFELLRPAVKLVVRINDDSHVQNLDISHHRYPI